MNEADQPRTIAGKYELEKLLGQGGMGEVWVARELSSGRKLALKLLKTTTADSKENRARFEREAHIATTLVSPHIAQVTDSGVDESGDPFMALELLHGEDLQQRIKSEKRLPVPQVVKLAIQVGRALHVAHSAGLVHRDLKPANIFLARQGDEEVFKVLDFGIAKMESTDSTEYTAAGAMLGTASYMSPEQIRSAKTVDHRADLWAFAVVLFRSLTGQFPFEETGFELFLTLMQDPIPVPRKITSLAPDLPAPLNVFFERSFVRDLGQRYPNASAAVVGFCRAAGVTVPADVLHAAAAPMPSAPVSTPQPGAPVSGPVASAPASAPAASGPVTAVPVSSSRRPLAATAPLSPISQMDPDHGPLSGTMMLVDLPLPAPGPGGARTLPTPAAGRPAEADTPAPDSGAGGVDYAATLFYQPGLKAPAAGAPESSAPESGGLAGGAASKPRLFTYPLEAARAAATELAVGGPGSTTGGAQLAQASQAAQLEKPLWAQPPAVAAPPARSRTWLWLVVALVVGLVAAAAWFFLVRVPV